MKKFVAPEISTFSLNDMPILTDGGFDVSVTDMTLPAVDPDLND